MSVDQNQNGNPNQSNLYQIKLKGSLEGQNCERFEGFIITLDKDGNTLLTGIVKDQAALHGVFKKIRDLGMTLMAINPVEPGQSNQPDVKSNLN
jgi:hypothetical protein